MCPPDSGHRRLRRARVVTHGPGRAADRQPGFADDRSCWCCACSQGSARRTMTKGSVIERAIASASAAAGSISQQAAAAPSLRQPAGVGRLPPWLEERRNALADHRARLVLGPALPSRARPFGGLTSEHDRHLRLRGQLADSCDHLSFKRFPKIMCSESRRARVQRARIRHWARQSRHPGDHASDAERGVRRGPDRVQTVRSGPGRWAGGGNGRGTGSFRRRRRGGSSIPALR
jgi:hypothetical protein